MYYVFEIENASQLDNQGLLKAAGKVLKGKLKDAIVTVNRRSASWTGLELSQHDLTSSHEKAVALCSGTKKDSAYLVVKRDSNTLSLDEFPKIESLTVIRGDKGFNLRIQHFENEFLPEERKAGFVGAVLGGFNAVGWGVVATALAVSGPLGWSLIAMGFVVVSLIAMAYCFNTYYRAEAAKSPRSGEVVVLGLEKLDYNSPPEWVISQEFLSAFFLHRSGSVDAIKREIESQLQPQQTNMATAMQVMSVGGNVEGGNNSNSVPAPIPSTGLGFVQEAHRQTRESQQSQDPTKSVVVDDTLLQQDSNNTSVNALQ